MVGVKRGATTVVCHGQEGILYRTNAYEICLARQFSPTHDVIVTVDLILAAASSVVKPDISPKSVVGETTWGRLCWATGVPVPNKPQQSQCSHGGSCEVKGNGHHGEIQRCCSRTKKSHPEILHSDQGRNFESSILAQTLQAFGVHKSQTTAYHPQGDGMVERFNRSLLQLLRAYVDTKSEWKHFPLVLYAYRTSTHSSTGVSPFLLMYGRNPSPTPFSKSNKFDSLCVYNALLLCSNMDYRARAL